MYSLYLSLMALVWVKLHSNVIAFLMLLFWPFYIWYQKFDE